MNEPTTEAGKRLLDLPRSYRHFSDETDPEDEQWVIEVYWTVAEWKDAIAAIEAEARADLAKRIEERVTALVGIDPLDDGHQHVLREDILALVREEATR